MEGKIYLSMLALVCATLVVLYALSLGINGTVLAGYLAVIGAVVGLPVGALIENKRQ